MREIIEKIASDNNLRRLKGRWAGPCPECGGSAGSDRFSIRDDGGYKCYACDFRGDIITWLRTMESMTCGQAHQEAGRECRNPSCPARSGCRMGDGKPGRRTRRRRGMQPIQAAAKTRLPVSSATMPSPRWLAWATGFQAKAAAAIAKDNDTLSWLAGRGIDLAAVQTSGLGLHRRNIKIDRAVVGLDPRGDKTTLWIPAGLVIPIWSPDGSLRRIRIRRTEADRARFLPDLKYIWIEGSGTGPMVIRPQSPRGAVIVEAELDAIAVAAAHDRAMVVAVGSVATGPDQALAAELATMPVIMVSLDADTTSDGKPGPGPRAIKAWTETYRQAKFWPVLAGKDPGEYAQAGGDLHAWIEAGLVQDVASTPDCAAEGGTGPDKGAGAMADNGPMVGEIVLKSGRTIMVTDDRATWEDLAAAGKTVFTNAELDRLRAAMSVLDDNQAVRLRDLVVECKDVFGAAYVAAGRDV